MMRRLNTSTLLFIALLSIKPAHANTEAERPAVPKTAVKLAQSPSDAKPAPDRVQSESQERRPSPSSRDEICQMIEAAAGKEAIPVPFFARLIWRESRFNPQAVSPVGAQGIAQFMPRTANGRGLADPFDPLTALRESAEYLGELLRQFGNLGLAAAAYNAGPKRVQDWLAKRGILRQETRDYVEIITGRSPAAWAADAPPGGEHGADDFRCAEIHKIAREKRSVSGVDSVADAPGAKRHEAAAARKDRSARKGILAKRAPTPIAASGARVRKMAEHRHKASEAKRKDAKGLRKEHASASRVSAKVAALSAQSRKTSHARTRGGRSMAHTATARRGSPTGRIRLAGNSRATVDKSCGQAKAGRKGCRSA
jgi:hypothetical protein